MTLFKMVKEIVTTKWLKAKCPECRQEYEYAESGYHPPTCSNPDCVQNNLHPELNGVRR